MGVALITPFKEDESVDYDALMRLVDYQLQNNTDFLCVLGTTAETPTLTEEEKKERELLRKEYIASVRMNLRAQLDNVDVQQEDGTIINLGEKYGIKKRH